MARGYLDRPNIAVLSGKHDVVLITGVDWEVPVREAAPGATIRTYDEAGAMPPAVIVDTLADVLEELGLTRGRVGIEGLRTPLVFAARLKELLPELELVPCDEVFREWRQQKSDVELRVMRTLAVHTDVAVCRALEKAGEGMTERELAALLMSEILDEGASAVPSVLVASGHRAGGLNAPTDKTMKAGEIVRIDLNSLWRGWYCDMGRMAVVGDANEAIRKDYADHVDFKQAILEEMVPGRRCAEIYEFYEAEARKRGLRLFRYPYIGLGHSIGVNNDEFPKLNRGHDDPLQPGMVMNVEPDTIGSDGAVHHVEDMVCVTDDGVEVITWSRDWSGSDLPVLGQPLA
jgi:Xaa-Pro aminopeptidase